MRLTYATVYAMHALVYLARHKGGRPLASHLIARPCGIPKLFLLKILKSLTQAGLLQSLRGPNGGYRLARKPKDISLLEVLEALEDPWHGKAPFESKGAGGPSLAKKRLWFAGFTACHPWLRDREVILVRELCHPLLNIGLQNAIGIFMLLECPVERFKQPLGRVVVQHEAVGQLNRLVGICCHLGVQAEVENQFFRRHCQPGEVGIRRQQVPRIDRKLPGVELRLRLRGSQNGVLNSICHRLCPS